MDSDSRQVDSDPDSDSRCPDSHITGQGVYLRLLVMALSNFMKDHKVS